MGAKGLEPLPAGCKPVHFFLSRTQVVQVRFIYAGQKGCWGRAVQRLRTDCEVLEPKSWVNSWVGLWMPGYSI